MNVDPVGLHASHACNHDDYMHHTDVCFHYNLGQILGEKLLPWEFKYIDKNYPHSEQLIRLETQVVNDQPQNLVNYKCVRGNCDWVGGHGGWAWWCCRGALYLRLSFHNQGQGGVDAGRHTDFWLQVVSNTFHLVSIDAPPNFRAKKQPQKPGNVQMWLVTDNDPCPAAYKAALEEAKVDMAAFNAKVSKVAREKAEELVQEAHARAESIVATTLNQAAAIIADAQEQTIKLKSMASQPSNVQPPKRGRTD